MSYFLAVFGGPRDLKLEPGNTIVISLATGGYSDSGVRIALAMGVRVIGAGRDKDELTALKQHGLAGSPDAQIDTIDYSGDEAEDTESRLKVGTIDVGLDFMPPQASEPLHLRSVTSALRRDGWVSSLGFVDQLVMPWTFIGKGLVDARIYTAGRFVWNFDEQDGQDPRWVFINRYWREGKYDFIRWGGEHRTRITAAVQALEKQIPPSTFHIKDFWNVS
jgi:NADPH:quinone reductase-like Zn-dependent oxidoreductase